MRVKPSNGWEEKKYFHSKIFTNHRMEVSRARGEFPISSFFRFPNFQFPTVLSFTEHGSATYTDISVIRET